MGGCLGKGIVFNVGEPKQLPFSAGRHRFEIADDQFEIQFWAVQGNCCPRSTSQNRSSKAQFARKQGEIWVLDLH